MDEDHRKILVERMSTVRVSFGGIKRKITMKSIDVKLTDSDSIEGADSRKSSEPRKRSEPSLNMTSHESPLQQSPSDSRRFRFYSTKEKRMLST